MNAWNRTPAEVVRQSAVSECKHVWDRQRSIIRQKPLKKIKRNKKNKSSRLNGTLFLLPFLCVSIEYNQDTLSKTKK